MQKLNPTPQQDGNEQRPVVETGALDDRETLGNDGLQQKLGLGGDPGDDPVADEVEAARAALRRACVGWGTDEALVFDTLGALSPEAKDKLRTDAEILEMLRVDLSRSELAKANALLGTTGDKKVDQLSSHLGRSEDWPGISGAIGGFLHALAPVPGRVFAAELGIDWFPTGFGVGFDFSIEGERLDEGFDLTVAFAMFVGAKTEGLFKAELGFKITAKANITADTAVECLDLLGLVVFDRLARDPMFGPHVASYLFGGADMTEIRENMDAPPTEPEPPDPEGDPKEQERYKLEKSAYDEADKETDKVKLSLNDDAGGSLEGNGIKFGRERNWEFTKNAETGELDSAFKQQDLIQMAMSIGPFSAKLKMVFAGESAKITITGLMDLDLCGLDVAPLVHALGEVLTPLAGFIATAWKTSGTRGDWADAGVKAVTDALAGVNYASLNAVPALLFADPTKAFGKTETELSVTLGYANNKLEDRDISLAFLSVFGLDAGIGDVEYKTGQKVSLT